MLVEIFPFIVHSILHNVLISTSQIGAGDININRWLMVVVETVNDEPGASSIRVPLCVSDVSGVETESLSGSWVSSGEENEENIVVSIKERLWFNFNGVQIHQVHATFIIRNQSPTVIWFGWCRKCCYK